MYTYKTKGTCASAISFSLSPENKIEELQFMGGCPGNTKGISKLVVGMDAEKVIELLEGSLCGSRGTSCPDQLSKALRAALTEQKGA